MDKSYIAIDSELVIEKDIFVFAHNQWFQDLSEDLDRPELVQWGQIYTQEKDYFPKVLELMKQKYSTITDEKLLTILARDHFFDIAERITKQYPHPFNRDNIQLIITLKDKYKIALISSARTTFLERIINHQRGIDVFDAIFGTYDNERGNKEFAYKRFIEKHPPSTHTYLQTQEQLNNLIKTNPKN